MFNKDISGTTHYNADSCIFDECQGKNFRYFEEDYI